MVARPRHAHVVGPFNLSINGDIGIVLDGFDLPPVFLTGHGRPYYDARVQELGYRKTKDVVAYSVSTRRRRRRARWSSAARRAREIGAHHAFARSTSRASNEELARDQRDLQRRVGGQLELRPVHRAEFAELASALKYLVPRELVQFAEVDGETAAMLVIVPNMNELIGDLNGRLLAAWAGCDSSGGCSAPLAALGAGGSDGRAPEIPTRVRSPWRSSSD